MNYQNIIETIKYFYHRLPITAKLKIFISRILRGKILHIINKQKRINSNFLDIFFLYKRPLSSFNNEDYIFYGVIDWHFRYQRPQHLALNIASRGKRVFYISPSFNLSKNPGFTQEKISNEYEIYQVHLNMASRDVIYGIAPSPEELKFLNESFGGFCYWAGVRNAISVIQHPNWSLSVLMLPIFAINLYDCMDYHDGFSGDGKSQLTTEETLLKAADLVITTSDFLEDRAKKYSSRTRLIRNGVDYDHFSKSLKRPRAANDKCKVVGYYGAIAEWFDIKLIQYLAVNLPNYKFLMVGADTAFVEKKLHKFKNVYFLGEKKYKDLPQFLNEVDICLLPFKVNDLTLATNPLKIYEYLAAGKAVVATSLPECNQFGDLIKCASTKEEFLSQIISLECEDTLSEISRRKEFSKRHTWQNRTDEFLFEIDELLKEKNKEILFSVIVITYNNLDLTQKCISSIQKNLPQGSYELIVIDNCSKDGTQDFLKNLSVSYENITIILNNQNRGFAAANNQGLKIAKGKYLVLLNNDTYITSDSFLRMANHLRNNPNIGLIGPVTNNIGNESKIDIQYDDMISMEIESKKYTYANLGKLEKIKTLAFFCVMMPRKIYTNIGLLDESFGLGFFEDDDYCRRVQKHGFLTVCAHDAYVHHHLSASFAKLSDVDRNNLFNINKKKYEKKWGTWQPHSYRLSNYERLPGDECVFNGFKKISGQCNICGMHTYFYYESVELFRESLFCGYCKSSSRYRSIASAILDIFDEDYGVKAFSLSHISRDCFKKNIKIYDTQQSFSYQKCAYLLPDYLKRIKLIEVKTSRYESTKELGFLYSNGVENQNLERLTFSDNSFNILITSDVMEHVRLDNLAHNEIYRVLAKGGYYIFNVPHSLDLEDDLIRVEIIDPEDPSKDKYIHEPEYHGDVNSSGKGALSYRVYGKSLLRKLKEIGFDVIYRKINSHKNAILNTEVFICKK